MLGGVDGGWRFVLGFGTGMGGTVVEGKKSFALLLLLRIRCCCRCAGEMRKAGG